MVPHDRKLRPYLSCCALASVCHLAPQHINAGRGRDAVVQMIDTYLRVHQHGIASQTTHKNKYAQGLTRNITRSC
jgi:hypothetical protein